MLDAKARYREAKAAYQAAREVHRLYGMEKNAIDTIEAGTEEPLSYFRLTAPVAGTINKRPLSPGQSIGATDTPIHLVNTETVWVFAEAYERDIPYLRRGKMMTSQVKSLSAKSFTGKIDWISRQLDEKTRTLRVRAAMNNPNGLLRAGMYGTVAIHTNGKGNMAMVPVDAVQRLPGHKIPQVVFVPGKEPHHFRPVSIQTGE